jgi:hypothetical protein
MSTLAEEPPKRWREKAKRGWIGLRTAGEAMGIAAVDRSHRIAERLVIKTQDGTLGKPTEEPTSGPIEEDGEMGIHVGDTVNHNYPPKASGLKKAAITAAQLAAGGGAGAGIPYLMGAFDKPDADTKYELRLGEAPE